jgi:hypothetical protein
MDKGLESDQNSKETSIIFLKVKNKFKNGERVASLEKRKMLLLNYSPKQKKKKKKKKKHKGYDDNASQYRNLTLKQKGSLDLVEPFTSSLWLKTKKIT